jgi:Flp pilus assembly protein TadG
MTTPRTITTRLSRIAAGTRRLRGDRGSGTVEYAVFVLPMCVLAVIFVLVCFRVAGARMDLASTAAASARAASLARSPQAAIEAAKQAATTDLAGHNLTCSPLSVSVDTSNFRAGGQVAVTITCTAHTGDLVGARLPGQINGSATAHAVIDSWREVDTG